MNQDPTSADHSAHTDYQNYVFNTLDEELRTSLLCKKLLKEFHQHLLQERELDPLDAGSQAAGADYFLIDFMIDNQRANIFDASELAINRFAGNWYIVSNLEPNIEELQIMLAGVENFYRYCDKRKLIPAAAVEPITAACQKIDYYQQRIDSFHEITGDGYSVWERACPLK